MNVPMFHHLHMSFLWGTVGIPPPGELGSGLLMLSFPQCTVGYLCAFNFSNVKLYLKSCMSYIKKHSLVYFTWTWKHLYKSFKCFQWNFMHIFSQSTNVYLPSNIYLPISWQLTPHLHWGRYKCISQKLNEILCIIEGWDVKIVIMVK